MRNIVDFHHCVLLTGVTMETTVWLPMLWMRVSGGSMPVGHPTDTCVNATMVSTVHHHVFRLSHIFIPLKYLSRRPCAKQKFICELRIGRDVDNS